MELFKLLGTIGLDNREALEGLDATTKKAKLTSEQIGNRFTAIGSKAQEIGQKFIGVSVACGGALTGMVKYASDMEESINKVDVAFGKNADDVKKWASSSLQQFGIAKGTALDMTATFGDMGTSMGLSTAEASKMATSLTGLAGDLSSFKNIGIEQSMTALNGVFTGETESLKMLGIVMTQTNLDAFALANGFGKTTKEMSQSEQVALRYAYIMDKTKNAQGDFARTGDSTANQLRKFKEGLKELSASIGTVLLPTVAKVVGVVNGFMGKFMNLSDSTKTFIVTLLGIGTALAPVLIFGGKIVSLIGTVITNWSKLISAIKTGLTFLMSNPIILVIAGVTTAIVLLYRHSEAFRTSVNNLAKQLQTALQPAFDSIKNVMTASKPLISQLVSILGSLATTIGNVLAPVITALSPLVASAFGHLANQVKANINIVIKAVGLLSKVASMVNKTLIQPVERASTKIKKSVDKIKKAFSSLKIKIPKFKVPSISVTWKSADAKLLKALGLKGLPSLKVKWNALGGIFNQPTILNSRNGLQGVGEAGAEAITPISVLKDYVREAVASENGEMASVMTEVLGAIKKLNADMPYAVAEGMSKQKIEWNDRELGRFVKTYAR